MASITKRGNGSYLVRVSCGTDENGKAIQKSKTFKPSAGDLTKAQAKKELKRFVLKFEGELEISKDVFKASTKEYSFEEFCGEYKRVKRLTLAPGTWSFYEKVISSILTPRLGRLRLSEIRPTHVQKVIEYLADPSARVDGKGKQLAAATVRRYLTVLQSVMALAQKQGYITDNPAETKHLELPKIATPEVEAFDDNEIAQVIEALEAEPMHIKAMISVALYTGARRGEIVGLKWSDIDLENGLLCISRSIYKLAGKQASEKGTKTESSMRTLAIPKVLCDILTEYKTEQDARKEYRGKDWFDGDYLFTEDDGHVMNPQTPTKQFDHFLKRHGIRHLKFHGLRHTSATLLLSHGCDIKTVSKRLGHSDIGTTNIYVHALAKADRSASDMFDRLSQSNKSEGGSELTADNS